MYRKIITYNSYFNIIFVFTRMFMKFNPFMKQGKLYNWHENLLKAPPASNKPFAPFYLLWSR